MVAIILKRIFRTGFSISWAPAHETRNSHVPTVAMRDFMRNDLVDEVVRVNKAVLGFLRKQPTIIL